MKFNTKTIHAGQKSEETSGAVMPPIFQTSTYEQEAPNKHKGYDYARVGNPTRTALEKMLAGLEGADEAACFSSGVAAMDALMKMLRPGDHVITTNDLYGGSYRLFTKVFEPYGIDFTFVDMTDISKVKDEIRPETKLMWIETPTNPLLRIVDIKGLVDIAKPSNILTVVDNTFASPYLQRPLEFGADAVLHSATKYLAGHSDVIHGAVASSNDEIMENLRFQTKTSGAVPGPMDCYLTLRGIKTLSVRVQRSVDNAKEIAAFLEGHGKVESVLYPGLKSHPQHDLAKKQMDDFGAMLSFTLKDDSIEAATKFMQNTKVFTLAESLGGVESLISHPASMTHGSIPKDVREKAGLKDSLIRISVGIEDAEDLIEDLKQAF
ncbi:MAG: cystathionine gamma-synthase [Balneola sp.]|nr:cystathionine gamma-synthase [Balneola sp.]MBE78604.1 cystathionine gamma-synthase [Balneola sp.]HBX66224.1 cystathionine gamma-synthase [Balneolaceae bacterium]|tara:strand:- start:5722 stop:6858 length:1137 start_codon:yes stop_codon:yes gene_type:complete